MIMLSKGIMVSRSASAFIYTPGSQIKSLSFPDEFTLAAFQNGEILQTKYVLLEREALPKNNSVGNLWDATKSLGASLGVVKKEDYTLVNFETGQVVNLNIEMDLKQVKDFCSGFKYESIFDTYGMPNSGHYYWRVEWFSTDSGPIAVIRERTSVYALNLKTGKKVEIFNRLLGINWIMATRKPDNRIELSARLGLETQKISDVEQFLKESPIARE